MLEFICYFMPTFISLIIYQNLNKESLKAPNIIIQYGVFNAVNNVLTLLVVCLKHINEPFGFENINFPFCLKYLVVAIIISILTPYAIKIIRENIKVEIEVKKNEEKKKNS